MIIDLKKFLIFGVQEEIDRFFDAAQEAGFLEFISKEDVRKIEQPQNIKDILFAIKILKNQPVIKSTLEEVDVDPIIASILHFNTSLESLKEKSRLLRQEIVRVKVFGDFSKEDIDFIEKESGLQIQFFCRKTKKQEIIPQELIYIATEYDLDYFISIKDKKMTFPQFIEIKIEKPLGLLQEELKVTLRQIHQFEEKLKKFAAFLPLIEQTLSQELNKHQMELAKKSITFPTNQPLFVAMAYVPENRVKYLKNLIDKLNISFEEISIDKDEKVPTCMQNKGYSRIGQDLVCVYDIPSRTDKDPSFWVFGAFSIFFAMIVADAGYGLFYLAIALYMKYHFKNRVTRFLKRMIRLTFVLSITCIIWGVLTASFFGMEIGPDSPFKKASVIHYLATKKAEYHIQQKDDVYEKWLAEYPSVKNTTDGHEFFLKASKIKDGKEKFEALDEFYDNILMEVSLLFGVIHLTIAFIRYLRRNLSGVGWILFMIGGYLYFPSLLNATSMVNFLGIIDKQTAYFFGEYLIYIGMSSAIVLAIIQRGLSGISEVMNLVQVFADVLSYLRLYALGLAGMMMASTFNMLGLSIGIIPGIFVIILGHLVNIQMGMISAVIHSIRLNFLEWYHYCFEGDGKLFNPLRKLHKEE